MALYAYYFLSVVEEKDKNVFESFTTFGVIMNLPFFYIDVVQYRIGRAFH